MAKGQTYNHERISFTDAKTGVHLLQLTSFPTMSMSLPYFSVNFTPDSKTLIFLSQREARRDAPWDLFRVDVDGANLTQLTESDGIGGFAISPDGHCVYFHQGNALCKVDMNDFREEEIVRLEQVTCFGLGFVSPDECYYFTQALTKGGRMALVRYRTDGTEASVLREWEGRQMTFHSCDPGGSGLLVIIIQDERKEYRLLDYDGDDKGIFTASYDFAHCTFLGRTGRLQGCALPPDRAVLQIGLGEEKPTLIAQGVYFWHSASTLDGEWIIADTNWPDEGLQLVHVPTGRYRPLCYARSSQGHPQWTHPHPQFSPNGRYVLFNSDRTGICQIYLAEIPDDLRERIKSGKLSAKERLLF
ncbi:MAG: oligogalacturonate lyase family protein [Candidatus Bathyarchaeia archaeon]